MAGDLGSLAVDSAQICVVAADVDLVREVEERRDGSVTRDAFLHAISHELRTPLTAVIGFSSLLVDHYGADLPPDALDLAARIRSSANRIERLLEDLLDVDRFDRGELEVERRLVPIAAAVQRAVERVGTADREVQVRVEPADLQAEVDPAQFDRLVENLLANAVRHTPARANILVEARPVDDGLLVVVEDDGPGVPAALRGRVFQPGAAPGIGVGLALVERFAIVHGGRAWVEDRAGGGSSFRVVLGS